MLTPVRTLLQPIAALHLFCYAAAAQPMTGGARSGALGGATTALDGDMWSRGNPAGHATVHRPGIAFFTSQGFGLAELRLGAAVAVVPTRIAAISLGAQTFGFEEYRANEFRAGLSRGVGLSRGRTVYAGLDAVYHRVIIERYGSAAELGLEAGLLAQITPELWIGIAAHNLHSPARDDTDLLEQKASFGLMYRPYERIRVLADIQKAEHFPWSVRAGIETWPVPALALRAGAGTEPVRFTAGTCVRVGLITAEVAAERHDVLGWTPGVALGVQW